MPRNHSFPRSVFRWPSLSAALLLAWAGSSTKAADWPNWRGPHGTGSTKDGHPPLRWSADQFIWKVALPGKGTSTPIHWHQRIYLTTPAEGEDAVMAFDARGNRLWQTKLGPESRPKHPTLASSCNASPVTDGSAIYVYFRSGHFAALDLQGQVRWQQNLVEQFGADRLFWDQGSSLVVAGPYVIVTRMHQGESWLAAFDKKTGAQQWRQTRQYQTSLENDNGYSTPCLFEHQRKPALLVWGAEHLTAHAVSDGSVLWSAGGFNPAGMQNWPAISTPVISDQMAVVSVGRDDRPNQAHLFGIRLGGSGDVTASHVAWHRHDLGVFVTSPAAYRGRVYLLRYRGEVVCLDPRTGKTIWSEALPRGAAPFYASPVIANGVLFAAREDGVVFSVKVGDRFELVGENPMGERILATPVPAGARLLLRGDQHLFCVGTP